MATKKIRILKELLPSLGIINDRYDVRYRIISEDRNRTSAWSPIYGLSLDNVVDFNDTEFSAASVTGDTIKNVSIGWVVPQELPATSYDVYIKPGLKTAFKSIESGLVTIKFSSDHNLVSGNKVIVTGLGLGYDGEHIITQSQPTGTSFIRYSTTASNETETPNTEGRVFRYTADSGYSFNATVPSPFYQVAIDGRVYDFLQIKVQVPTETKALDSKALLQTSSEINI